MEQEFLLGNTCMDLYELTIDMTGNKDDKTPRYPRRLYDTYVNEILNSAKMIAKNVVLANESRDLEERVKLQNEAISYCTWLNRQIRSSCNKGYISYKQKERWANLVVSVKRKILNWQTSDLKRNKAK